LNAKPPESIFINADFCLDFFKTAKCSNLTQKIVEGILFKEN